MAARTETSKARRALIKNLNAKVESLQGQIISLKFEIEDAESEKIELSHKESQADLEKREREQDHGEFDDSAIGDAEDTGA